jgi:hypothetical protein
VTQSAENFALVVVEITTLNFAPRYDQDIESLGKIVPVLSEDLANATFDKISNGCPLLYLGSDSNRQSTH